MRPVHKRIWPLALAVVCLWVSTVLPASALDSVMFAGSWGPGDSRQGHVWRYESGIQWTRLSPPQGLGDAVWDLAWRESDGTLWAATHTGNPATQAELKGHGYLGQIWRYKDGLWRNLSEDGGWQTAVTTVSIMDDQIYATVDREGLFRYDNGDWIFVDSFLNAGQAIVSESHDGAEMLFVGQDDTDEFWVYDPDGSLLCGDPVSDPTSGQDCQLPDQGNVCSADCHVGSCIHAMTEFDSGDGTKVYGGAWLGKMYRWNPSTRLFVPIDSVPLVGVINQNDPLLHVQGLAAFQGLLWVGMSSGEVWTTSDAMEATYEVAKDFSAAWPISEMVTVPEDGLLWFGHGGVPYRWARRDGGSVIRTFDGFTYVERSSPGEMGSGVLTLLGVVPEITCDAGAAQSIECEGDFTEVQLDASGTTVSPGFEPTYTWTGPFLEGTVTGIDPIVHFDGPGDYEVVLTVRLASATETCATQIQIVDTEPPVFEAKGACLWPPNHRYRCFDVAELTADGTGVAQDICEGEVPVRIIGVSSSQPEDVRGGGDGHTQDDMLFDESTVCLRAERQGGDSAGRIYTVVLAATDSGNTTIVTLLLGTPHDQSDHPDCGCSPCDVGLRPNEALPLGPDAQEGSYPTP